MNITCDNCGKRYKMKAEQMKKAFKTKCKRCSHVIIVRPDALAQKAPQEQVKAEPKNPSVESPIWYVVINGQQSGPYTPRQLAEYLSAGSIDQESFVWKEGMASWESLGAVSELKSLFNQTTPAPVTSAQPNQNHDVVTQPQASSNHEFKISPAVEVESSVPVDKAKHSPALSMGIQIGHSRDLLDQVRTQPVAAQSHSSASSGSASALDNLGQLSNQRNDNSVLFSLDSIDAVSGNVEVQNPTPLHGMASQSSSPLITNTGGSEGSGLIDLSALSSLTGHGSHGNGAGRASINLSVGTKNLGGKRSLTNGSSDIKSIALAVISTALVLVLSLVVYQKYLAPAPVKPLSSQGGVLGKTKSTQTSALKAVDQANTSAKEKSGQSASTIVAPKTQADSDTKLIASSVSKAKSTETKKTKPQKRKARSKSRSRSRAKNRSKRRSKSRSRSRAKRSSTTKSKPRTASRSSTSRKPKAKSSEANALLRNLRGGRTKSRSPISSPIGSSSKRSGPKKPSKTAVRKAMKRVNVRSCLSREPALRGKGKIRVRIMAVSSGSIKSAKVTNAPFKNSPVGACLEREVRKQRFPSFTDSSISFTYPFSS